MKDILEYQPRGGYFFYFDSFNELKEAIEKGK